MAKTEFGDFNVWKCDLCHATVVLQRAYEPEGWIAPRIVLTEVPCEVVMPTLLCAKCRMSVIYFSPMNIHLFAREIYCKKDETYKLCDQEDKVIATSKNRTDWKYHEPSEATCLCSDSCEHYPSEAILSEKIPSMDIIHYTCSVCSKDVLTTSEKFPEGWLKLSMTDEVTKLKKDRVICIDCLRVIDDQKKE